MDDQSLYLKAWAPSITILKLAWLQVNAYGVERNFYAGDQLPLFYDELAPCPTLIHF